MKLKNLLTLSLLTILSITGCGGGGDERASSDTQGAGNDSVQTPIVIDGYTLPPVPDKALNDSTLLGIDSNDNGVRDDVEIWIYTTYKKPIERAVFMQKARAYQIVIKEPEKALENLHYMHDAVDCKSYWSYLAKDENKTSFLEEYRNYSKELKPVQFNTKKRFLAYEKYNHTLSGGVYGSSSIDEWKNKCDFNTSNF